MYPSFSTARYAIISNPVFDHILPRLHPRCDSMFLACDNALNEREVFDSMHSEKVGSFSLFRVGMRYLARVGFCFGEVL